LTRRVFLGVIGVGSVAAAGVAAFGFGGDNRSASATAPTPHLTSVRREDLHDVRVIKGRLGFGESTVVTGRLAGVITDLAPVGTVVGRGEVLCRVDEQPVFVLFGGSPAWRDLSAGLKGEDVRQLQENLAAMGDFSGKANGTYAAATTAAVMRWQRRAGMTQTGSLKRGRVVFTAGPVRVAAHVAQPGDSAMGPLVEITGTTRAVSLNLSPADRDLAREGAAVVITLSGGKTLEGKVESVINSAATGPNGTDELSVTIAVTDQAAVANVGDAAVDVTFALDERRGVLTVPVTALLALREGGYGVQIVDDAGTRTIAVQVGLFAQGRVEVSGGGLTEGAQVVVP
jgi:peptidoglycan hydrolase-like protein with peptidoglycan-binding domain